MSIFSVLVFTHLLRTAKYIRLIPVWGPMLLTVILTLQQSDVQLFLLVALFTMIISAMPFSILFSTTHPDYSNYIKSLYIAFRSSLGNEFDAFEAEQTIQYDIIFVAFVIVAIVLVNLLIGLVTDVILSSNNN